MSLPPLGPGEPGRADVEHESRCRRCGVSCHVAMPLRGRPVVVPGLHCTFLAADPDGRFQCTVYAERFEKAPWCHHAEIAAPLGYLAVDCPYGVQPGLGKVRLDEREFAKLWPDVLRKLRSWGVPAYIGRAAMLAEVERREGEPYVLEPWPGDPERLRLRPAGRPTGAKGTP